MCLLQAARAVIFIRAIGSAEGRNATSALKTKLTLTLGISVANLREYVMGNYLALHWQADESSFLLSSTIVRSHLILKHIGGYVREINDKSQLAAMSRYRLFTYSFPRATRDLMVSTSFSG
jgi:hypothetical protein